MTRIVMPMSTDGHGRTSDDRHTARQRIIDTAIKNARYTAFTERCRRASEGIDDHRLCRGESRGGAGCLCTCHDPIAEIIRETS